MTRLAIINRHARGALERPRLAEIVAFLDGQGIAHRQIQDSHHVEAVRTALAGLRSSDCVIALGGDGTVNALLPAVLRSGATLAVYPMGTQNNLARRVGMPEDLQAFTDILGRGEVRKLGLGSVNGRPFATLVSIGAGSVAAWLTHLYRRPLGLVRRVWPGGLTWLPFVCAVTFYRMQRLEVDATPAQEPGTAPPSASLIVPALWASALDETNRGMRTTELRGLDRQSLAVTLGTSFARLELLTGYQQIFQHARWSYPAKGLQAFDAAHLTVRSIGSEPLTAYGDGEVLVTATSFEIACLPSALDILVSPDLQA